MSITRVLYKTKSYGQIKAVSKCKQILHVLSEKPQLAYRRLAHDIFLYFEVKDGFLFTQKEKDLFKKLENCFNPFPPSLVHTEIEP